MAGEAATELPGGQLPARGAPHRSTRSWRPPNWGTLNNIGIYSDGRFSYQLTIYVFLYDGGTAMSVLGPDNPIAQKSIARYIGAMRSVCQQIADNGDWGHGVQFMRRLASLVVRWPVRAVIAFWIALAVALPLSLPNLNDMAQSTVGHAARRRTVHRRRSRDDEGFQETGTDDLLLVVLSDERGVGPDQNPSTGVVDALRP